jgi:TetR/AcrR family transcriptional regulator, copper-responsive repressor
MGRPKKFNRTDVLEKAMPLFWKQGYANTGLQDLEKVTGVNKSGLYSEFKDKEDLFLASLRYYYETRSGGLLLSVQPLGWDNIENFLKFVIQPRARGQNGCFGVCSMRELGQLSKEAHDILTENRASLKRQLTKNIAASKPTIAAELLTEVVSTFFSGLCIEQNLNPSKASAIRKIKDFMEVIRSA